MKRIILNLIAHLISNLLPSKIMRNKKFFQIWEAKGYHITPVHYYEPVPNSQDLKPYVFDNLSSMTGINMNEDEQIILLYKFYNNYYDEYSNFSFKKTELENVDFYFGNNSFETVDAEILYCIIREFKPKRVIEIGSGFSTRIIAKAIRKNVEEDKNYKCELVCIEPYPKTWLNKINEITKLVEQKIEELNLNLFDQLEENDILFIDSTHTINVYNDVCFEYLEIVPKLNKGVLIHIHDILLPQKYCRYWFEEKKFWNEQYLLQAFLTYNNFFKILWGGNYMHLMHSSSLIQYIPSYSFFKSSPDERQKVQGHKSFWIQKIN